MALPLYRRHSASCVIAKSKISARSKRLALNCACPIWMCGRVGSSLVPRQSTGFVDIADAEAMRDALVARAKYCERHGIFAVRNVSVDLLESFKVEGLAGLADTSKSTAVANLRCFLRHAFRRGWIKESLVDKVTPHRAIYTQKEPYSEQEIASIMNEALKLNGGRHGYARYPKTFRLLLELMLETGMRVGDAIRFDPVCASIPAIYPAVTSTVAEGIRSVM